MDKGKPKASAPAPTPASLPGGKWMDMLSDILGSTDPKLDQIKKSIQKLREEGELENLAVNLYKSAEEGFKKDLEELGITGEAQKPYLATFEQTWKKHEMSKKAEEIMNSPESKALNDFIGNTENMEKIREVIASAKPQSKWGSILSKLTSYFPDIKKYLGGLAPLLSSFGLGHLVEKKTAQKTTDEKPEDGKKSKTKKGKEKTEGPKKTLADLPEKWVPKGKTLIMGDSNLDGNRKLKFKKTDTLDAKGSMQATWAIPRIERMGEKINEYDNLVIGFGGNDLGAVGPEEILARYRKIVNQVRKMNKKKGGNFRTKIFIVTTPPVGDGTKLKLSGNWGKNHKETNDKRNRLNTLIRGARTKGSSEFIDFDEVIDMAATEKNGGVSNDELTAMEKGLNRQGDPVHVKGGEYAKRVRFAMYLSEKKDKGAA